MALRRMICLLILCCSFQSTQSKIYLELQKRIFLPETPTPDLTFLFDSDSTANIAYDDERKLIYAAVDCNIHVINAGTPGALTLLTTANPFPMFACNEFEFSDVIVCGDYVLATFNSLIPVNVGDSLMMYNKYNSASNTLQLRGQILLPFGSDPTHITATKDCLTLYVALGSHPSVANLPGPTIQDRRGEISVLSFDSGLEFFIVKNTLNFEALDSQTADLVAKGVRFVYQENGNTLSRDLEPGFIVLNSDETRAYVGCQENNAMIVLDITDRENPSILEVIPFSAALFKSLDASQADNAINIRLAGIRPLLQPNGLKIFKHDGEEYIATANEGNTKEIKDGDTILYTDIKTGQAFVTENLVDISVSADLKAALGDPTKLGQLQFSTVDGLDETSNKYTQFYTFGGRSFSLIRTSDNMMIYDSGSSLEKTISVEYPLFFNTKPSGDKRPDEILENRSPIRGPEPKSLDVGQAYGKTLIFIGSGYPGTISIYSMAKGSVRIGFESVFFGADVRKDETWKDVYNGQRTGDLDPEDVLFVPSTSDKDPPLLYVTGRISGTVSCYKVLIDDVDECVLNTDNCDENAICVNTLGSYTCTCCTGFSGDGVSCTDVDECVLKTDNCGVNARCENTPGSHTCKCFPGYTGDGLTCVDVDECALKLDNCHEKARCINTPGSYTCKCLHGYTGNGLRCKRPHGPLIPSKPTPIPRQTQEPRTPIYPGRQTNEPRTPSYPA